MKNHVLMPGFINCHTHAAMYLFKSYGDDQPLNEWLRLRFLSVSPVEHYIWPMEGKYVNDKFVRDVLIHDCIYYRDRVWRWRR